MFDIGLRKEEKVLLENISRALLKVYDLIKNLEDNREIVIRISLSNKNNPK